MATSASVHTNSWDGRTITLLVEETATSIENNTSTVKWTLTSGTSSTYHNVYEITAWVGGTADANKVYGPKTATWDTRAFPCKDGSTSGTIPIQHNADGTASPVTFRLRGSVRNNSPQNYDGSITLTTIPRASSFTISKTSGGSAATSWNLGEALYVNITRASSSFTHKVYFVVGNSGNQVISNSAGTSANTTLASSLAQYIPSSSATATIYVDTYSGSTKIGSASKTFTINVPSNVLPSISSVTKTDTANYLSTYGAYVQGKSSLRVQTSASGNYSSITNYTVQLKSGSTVLNTKTGNDVTFSNISYTGTITVLVTVTDSRNRQATNSSTITVAPYETPKITTFTAERLSNNDIITIKLNASITNVNNNNSNAKHFYVWAREKGTSSWGSAIINNSSSYTYNNTSSPFTISKDENKGWEFLVNATDSFTTTSQTIEVGTVFELMNWKSDGTGMAIGKVSEKSNTFEVALKTELENTSIDGTLGVTGNTTMGGTLSVTGNTSIGGNLDVTGNYILRGFLNSSTGNTLFRKWGDGDTALSADGKTLYIGYQNTTGLNFLGGKAEMSASSNSFAVGPLHFVTNTPSGASSMGRIKFLPKTSYSTLSSTTTESDYLQKLLKWICNTYSSYNTGFTFIGQGEPNSQGNLMIHIYNCTLKDGTTGLPQYSSGTYFALSGDIYSFGTKNYSFFLYKHAIENVLYDNATGTNGNVTLSETAGNFKYLEIFFRDNGNTEFHSEKIYSPNGKSTTIGFIRNYVSGSNLYVYLFSKNITINGTTITSNRGSYIQFLNKTINSNTSDNYVYITRVVGYR